MTKSYTEQDSGVELAVQNQLVVIAPDGEPQILPLDSFQPTTLGSDPTSDVVLAQGDISPNHLGLIPTEDTHRLVGIETYGKLFLNGRRVREAVLEPFDRIRVGPYDLIYLPGEIDAHKVKQLLRAGSGQTQQDEQLRGAARIREKLLWLLFMTQELPPGTNPDPVLDLILEEVVRWTDYEGAALILSEPAGIQVRRALNLGLRPGEDQILAPFVADVVASNMACTEPVPIGAERAAVCFPVSESQLEVPERRILAVSRIEGTLVLTTSLDDPPTLDVDAVSLIQALARQIGILLSNTRVYRQATVDGLTGLATRPCAEQVLVEEARRSRTKARPLSLLLLDVDDFKRVNDVHGHGTGDEVLRELGGTISSLLRGEDFAARWGGEEFLILLPDTSLAGAQIVAQKLVSGINSSPKVGIPSVSVSIGVAVYAGPGEDVEGWVSRADEALYAAKRNGKSRFEVGLRNPATRRVTRPDQVRDEPPTVVDAAPCLYLDGPFMAPRALTPGTHSLGRSPVCDVVLAHPAVSRRHGYIFVDPDGSALFTDTSTNGTQLNGRPASWRVELKPGDRISLGPFDLGVLASAVARDEETE